MARPRADPRSDLARHRVRRPVHPGHHPRPVRRGRRRCAAQATRPDRDPDGDDDPRRDPCSPRLHERRRGLDDPRAGLPARHRQRRRYAGPPGVLDRARRARGHRQRGGPQLGHVQRRTRHRPSARRSGDRRVRRRPCLRHQRGELPRGHHRVAPDGRGDIPRAEPDRPARLGTGGRAQPQGRPPVRPADPDRPARGRDGRRRGDGRDELQRADPGIRPERPAERRRRLRVPDGRVRRRVAAGGRSAGHRWTPACGPPGDGCADPRSGVARAGRDPRVPGRPRPDGLHRLRVDPHGCDRQYDDPARRPGPPPWPGDERLHHGVQRLGPDRRPGDGGCRLCIRGADRDRTRRCPVAARGSRGVGVGQVGCVRLVGGPAPSNPTGGMVPGGAHPR